MVLRPFRCAGRFRFLNGFAALLTIAIVLSLLLHQPSKVVVEYETQPSEINHTKTERNSRLGAIPKIIHQTFKTHKIFNEYRKYIEHCLKLNPDWEYYLWTDEDIVAFINDHYPYFMRKYLSFKMHVQRGDSIRYMVLHHFGGIYIDMDVECVKPFFPSLEKQTAFVDQEAREHAVILYGMNFSAMNSAMGSVRGHPFFLRLVFAMMEVDDGTEGAGATTGPTLLNSQLINWWAHNSTRRHHVTLLEPSVFSPLIDDELHDFRRKCKLMHETTRSPRGSAGQQLHDMRLQLCRLYTQRNWKHDLSGPQTVGRHHFLHLGYRWYGWKNWKLKYLHDYFNYFDIKDIARNVKFYSRHKSTMVPNH